MTLIKNVLLNFAIDSVNLASSTFNIQYLDKNGNLVKADDEGQRAQRVVHFDEAEVSNIKVGNTITLKCDVSADAQGSLAFFNIKLPDADTSMLIDAQNVLDDYPQNSIASLELINDLTKTLRVSHQESIAYLVFGEQSSIDFENGDLEAEELQQFTTEAIFPNALQKELYLDGIEDSDGFLSTLAIEQDDYMRIQEAGKRTQVSALKISELKGALLVFVFFVADSNGQLQYDEELPQFSKVKDTDNIYEFGSWGHVVDVNWLAERIVQINVLINPEDAALYATLLKDAAGKLNPDDVIRTHLRNIIGDDLIEVPQFVIDKLADGAIQESTPKASMAPR